MTISLTPEPVVSRSTISRISGVTSGLLDSIRSVQASCIGPAIIWNGIDRTEETTPPTTPAIRPTIAPSAASI